MCDFDDFVNLGIENICVDLDVEFLVYLITNLSIVNLNLESLLIDCRNLTKSFPNFSMTHAYREVNNCTDRLARKEAELTSNHLFLYNPLPVVVDLLAMNKVGGVYNRLIVP